MEYYKPIEGFDGYYITTNGKVISDLGRGNRDRSKRVKKYLLKPRYSKNGYQRVCLRDTETNKRVDKYIYQLVARAFLPNHDNKKIVHHKDTCRNNNHVNNLEWSTYEENNAHTRECGHVIRDSKGRYQNINQISNQCIVHSPK